MRCYVVDIDGTVADLSHRLHHIQKTPADWNGFYAACSSDSPIVHMHEVVRALRCQHSVVYITGRSESSRYDTAMWLGEHTIVGSRLYMRPNGDHRPDDVVKLELYRQAEADGWKPIMVFEDRDAVVKMWRENGIPCAQVAAGAF